MKKRAVLILILMLFILIILTNLFLLNFFSTKITNPTSQASIQFSIAKSKAIKIIRESFEGDTTDFTLGGNLGLENIEDMTLEKIDFGKIVFTEPINLTQDAASTTEDILYSREVSLDDNVIISKNLIEINTANLKSLEKPAILYLYGLTFNNPRILKDGEVCPSSICQILDYSNGILKFSVTGFTSYSSEETPIEAKAQGGACTYDWECAFWQPSTCPENGIQTRICTNQGTCSGIVEKPDEIRTCVFEREKFEPKKSLLDIKVSIPEMDHEIFPGEIIISKIELINFGEAKRVDAVLEYRITDFENTTIFHEIETLAFETRLNLIKEIKLPDDLKAGRYFLYVDAEYNGQTASALTEFQAVKIPQKEKIFILIILFLIIVLAILIYVIIRQREKYVLIKKADIKKIIKNNIK